MRSACLVVSMLAVSACCFGGAPSASPAPSTGPGVPPGTPVTSAMAACPDVAIAILGTWAREGFVEEYRSDGTYVINGREGSFRWVGPGHAFLEVPGSALHHEYHLGLTDVNELIAIDPNRVGSAYARTSPAPAIDPACFDLRASIVGTWIGGSAAETYSADGAYRVNDTTGRWSLPTNGHLHLESAGGLVNDYWFAITGPTSALAIPMPPLANEGTVYIRQ